MPDAEDERWGAASQIGVRVERLRRLVAELQTDFRPEDWGFAHYDDIQDLRQRAIVSDQVLTAADAVLTNLVEARVCEIDYSERADEGIRFRDVQDLAHNTRLDLAVVGYFRAFGSALDCLSAVVIGLLRVPSSIQKASMHRDLFDLDPARASTDEQRLAWADVKALLDRHRAGPPDGWIDWALGTRNAFVHRPRQIRMMLPRPAKTRLVLPPQVVRDEMRFELHLRRRPSLPDLQHLALRDGRVEDLFLHESAGQTLRGLTELTNIFVDNLAGLLVNVCGRLRSRALVLTAPAERWQPEADAAVAFNGFAPVAPTRFETLVGHPLMVKRLALAQRIADLPR